MLTRVRRRLFGDTVCAKEGACIRYNDPVKANALTSGARRDRIGTKEKGKKMNKGRVSLKFMNLSDPDLAAFTDNIAARLGANANFPSPVVSAASLLTTSSKFIDSIADAAFGDCQAIAGRNIIRNIL